MEKKKTKDLIIQMLNEKASVKNEISLSLNNNFKKLVEVAKKYASDIKHVESNKPTHNLLDVYDKNSNSFEIRLGEETLLFHKLSAIFQIDKSHQLWSSSYISDNYLNSYVGIINIYNFLSDSLRQNRIEDQGYLIARILINREGHFFVEGKRQLGFLYNDFINAVINETDLANIIESSLLYSLDFDITVPDYDAISVINVGGLLDQIDFSIPPSTKKLGFKFYTED